CLDSKTGQREFVPVGSLVGAKHLGVGSTHVCALMKDDTVGCVGTGFDGTTTSAKLQREPYVDYVEASPIAGLTGATDLAAGVFFTCALLTDRTVGCWGIMMSTGSGTAGLIMSSTPVAVGNVEMVSEVAAGGQHACALLVDGRVSCWGDNQYGELAGGTAMSVPPTVVSGLPRAIEVSTGVTFNCALLADDRVACWTGATADNPTILMGT
ncbi:MAG TPA: hypothetical protein VG963_32235, partial [Polyangiaceae bacterium]|nr:hypothetical protein [Polyangiaceae bacterium]